MHNKLFRASLAMPLLALASIINAGQLGAPTRDPLIGARNLSISPDGKRLAFSYQGDIWVASADGGRAFPLTNHIEMDDNPVWSPDGEWIAFASNRFGNWDIFVAPAEGGQTKRLTYHSGSDVPSDWSSDGSKILFRATRDNPANGVYTIDVANGTTKQIFLDMMSVNQPKFMSDGSIVYTRLGFTWQRPRYHGSGAAQVWRYNPTTGTRSKLMADEFQHLWVNSTPKGMPVMAVSAEEVTPSSFTVGKPIPKNVDNVRRTPNVYAIDAPGKKRRITDFVETGARFLTVARNANVAAFERDGDVYVMQLGQQPKKVSIYTTLDDKTTMEERLVLTNGATTATLSPDNGTFVFGVRGELWSVPTKKGKGPNADDATQLTDWAGLDDNPIHTPDGKAIFFESDREGGERLYRMDLESKRITPITKGDNDILETRLTPDKKKVSFWMTGPQGGLYTVPVEGGAPTLVMAVKGNYDADYDWSPDMRYVAYSDALVGSGFYYWNDASNIWILDTQTGEKRDITQLSVTNRQPRWTPDGKYLYFLSDRNGTGIYSISLKPDEARPTDTETKYEKPTGPVKVEIDFSDIENRARKIVNQPPSGQVRIDPETGEILMVSEGDIWKGDYNGENMRRITNGGGIGDFDFQSDGKGLSFIKNGTLNTLNLRVPQFPVAATAFRADWTRDIRKERQAAFEQFWRAYNRSFYDPNFHGRDWAAIKTRYAKLLPSVGHRNEMATVLGMMVHELEASHSEVGAGPGNPGSQNSAHLGFLVDYGYDGPGIKVGEVPARTPGSYTKTKLNPGDVITKINGKEVSLNEALYRDVLNEQLGRDVTYTVKGPDGKTRDIKFRAISGGEFGGIMWQNRLDARRRYVEEKSGGKLTYVHIAGMGEGELQRFNQQVWQYGRGKKGVIIDVRNNGGGNTADRIIDVLERAPSAVYQPRDQESRLGPGQSLNVPMVVMHAETSFSNAEMFPAFMKARKLATLVGMPTPGYVIYTYGLPLIDGTQGRMPSVGVFRLDGTPTENMGQQPDYKVDITPEEYFSGRDPQLDKAIEVLLKQVK